MSRRFTPFYKTKFGRIFHADSLQIMKSMPSQSVDLIVTSPPFALTRKKEYGNAPENEYLNWFRGFAAEFYRLLKDNGSLVIDIGGAWKPGAPVRSLYHFKLLVMLCDEFKFHLAQDFYWWNPSKLPTPAEWVNIRRIRVKDAINPIWWLSKSEWPRASNRRVLQPYSPSMESLLVNGYTAKLRPSGHDISEKFSVNNGAAIPPNLIALPNTESNSSYMRYCQKNGLKPHPARFPSGIPEFFIRMLTDPQDLVFDPFAGSCVTGEVAERLSRRWVCVELLKDYLNGAVGRFSGLKITERTVSREDDIYYRVPKPGLLWGSSDTLPLDETGGRTRSPSVMKQIKKAMPKCPG